MLRTEVKSNLMSLHIVHKYKHKRIDTFNTRIGTLGFILALNELNYISEYIQKSAELIESNKNYDHFVSGYVVYVCVCEYCVTA